MTPLMAADWKGPRTSRRARAWATPHTLAPCAAPFSPSCSALRRSAKLATAMEARGAGFPRAHLGVPRACADAALMAVAIAVPLAIALTVASGLAPAGRADERPGGRIREGSGRGAGSPSPRVPRSRRGRARPRPRACARADRLGCPDLVRRRLTERHPRRSCRAAASPSSPSTGTRAARRAHVSCRAGRSCTWLPDGDRPRGRRRSRGICGSARQVPVGLGLGRARGGCGRARGSRSSKAAAHGTPTLTPVHLDRGSPARTNAPQAGPRDERPTRHTGSAEVTRTKGAL